MTLECRQDDDAPAADRPNIGAYQIKSGIAPSIVFGSGIINASQGNYI
jgi:hypothetical protein